MPTIAPCLLPDIDIDYNDKNTKIIFVFQAKTRNTNPQTLCLTAFTRTAEAAEACLRHTVTAASEACTA